MISEEIYQPDITMNMLQRLDKCIFIGDDENYSLWVGFLHWQLVENLNQEINFTVDGDALVKIFGDKITVTERPIIHKNMLSDLNKAKSIPGRVIYANILKILSIRIHDKRTYFDIKELGGIKLVPYLIYYPAVFFEIYDNIMKLCREPAYNRDYRTILKCIFIWLQLGSYDEEYLKTINAITMLDENDQPIDLKVEVKNCLKQLEQEDREENKEIILLTDKNRVISKVLKELSVEDLNKYVKENRILGFKLGNKNKYI